MVLIRIKRNTIHELHRTIPNEYQLHRMCLVSIACG